MNKADQHALALEQCSLFVDAPHIRAAMTDAAAFLRSQDAEKQEAEAERLRAHWDAFCDADPVPDGFIEEMEAAGFTVFRPVAREDLQSAFAADRGIYKGGMVYDLTPKGRNILVPPEADERARFKGSPTSNDEATDEPRPSPSIPNDE